MGIASGFSAPSPVRATPIPIEEPLPEIERADVPGQGDGSYLECHPDQSLIRTIRFDMNVH